MPRSLHLFLTLATLSVGAQAGMQAQTIPATNPADPGTTSASYPNVTSIQPAPRGNMPQVNSTQPIPGVWLRSESGASLKTVSADANGTEIRVEHGKANVQVFHPAGNTQILVDLPGGQTSLIKDGLYTFNADTDTVAVVRGEMDAYPGGNNQSKPIKVKEDHELALTGNTKPVEVDPRQIAADILPGQRGMGEDYNGNGYGPGYGYGAYGDGPYYPPYPYPYYAYGWGNPYYGYGYPFGFGLGFGYYGGFRGGYGGGFRGGYGGGFRGGSGGGFHR